MAFVNTYTRPFARGRLHSAINTQTWLLLFALFLICRCTTEETPTPTYKHTITSNNSTPEGTYIIITKEGTQGYIDAFVKNNTYSATFTSDKQQEERTLEARKINHKPYTTTITTNHTTPTQHDITLTPLPERESIVTCILRKEEDNQQYTSIEGATATWKMYIEKSTGEVDYNNVIKEGTNITDEKGSFTHTNQHPYVDFNTSTDAKRLRVEIKYSKPDVGIEWRAGYTVLPPTVEEQTYSVRMTFTIPKSP